jgi:predicted transcriptional regulator
VGDSNDKQEQKVVTGVVKKQFQRWSPSQQAVLEREVSRRYFKGMVQAEIATELNIAQTTVSLYLRKAVKKWEKENLTKIDIWKQEELAKINNLELEYWTAWKRSCEDAEKETQKGTKVGGNVSKQEIQKSKEGQSGDARFLQGIQWCIEQRCKIIGMEAPKKFEGNIKEHSTVFNIKDAAQQEAIEKGDGNADNI